VNDLETKTQVRTKASPGSKVQSSLDTKGVDEKLRNIKNQGVTKEKDFFRFSEEKLRKVITHIFFSDFSGDVLGFCIDFEGFAVLVRQHKLHHRLF